MKKPEALRHIDTALNEVQGLLANQAAPDMDPWFRRTVAALERIFGPQSRQLEEFKSVPYSPPFVSSWSEDDGSQDMKRHGLEMAAGLLRGYREEIETHGMPQRRGISPDARVELDRISVVELIGGVGRLSVKSALLVLSFVTTVFAAGVWTGQQRQQVTQRGVADSLRYATARADSMSRANRILEANARQSDSLRRLVLDSLARVTVPRQQSAKAR